MTNEKTLPTLKEQIDFMKLCVNNTDMAHPASQEMVEGIYQSLVAARIYQQIGAQEQTLVTNLREALKQAVSIMRQLHGSSHNEDVAEQRWERFYNEAPEMTLIRQQNELTKAIAFSAISSKPEFMERGCGDDYPVIEQKKTPVHSYYHELAEQQHRNQKLK
jgi:hypothetical protein